MLSLSTSIRIILHKANVYCPCQGRHKETGRGKKKTGMELQISPLMGVGRINEHSSSCRGNSRHLLWCWAWLRGHWAIKQIWVPRRVGSVAFWGYLFLSSKACWNMNQDKTISTVLFSLNQKSSSLKLGFVNELLNMNIYIPFSEYLYLLPTCWHMYQGLAYNSFSKNSSELKSTCLPYFLLNNAIRKTWVNHNLTATW